METSQITRPIWRTSPRMEPRPAKPPKKPLPISMPRRPAPNRPAARPVPKPNRRGCAADGIPAVAPPGVPTLGVWDRWIGAAWLGAVLVGGGALYVRAPREPKLPRPPPTRASATPAASVKATASRATERPRRDNMFIIVETPFCGRHALTGYRPVRPY